MNRLDQGPTIKIAKLQKVKEVLRLVHPLGIIWINQAEIFAKDQSIYLSCIQLKRYLNNGVLVKAQREERYLQIQETKLLDLALMIQDKLNKRKMWDNSFLNKIQDGKIALIYPNHLDLKTMIQMYIWQRKGLLLIRLVQLFSISLFLKINLLVLHLISMKLSWEIILE